MLEWLRKRGQTTTEYMFLIVGVIIFVVLIYTLLQGGVINKRNEAIKAGLGDFLKAGETFLFYDNFDSGRADQWNSITTGWGVVSKEYVQSDLTNKEKVSTAGSSGWINYYADTLVSFKSPTVAGILGGISGRVNKNSGTRYSCLVYLVNPQTMEAKINLYRFFSWQGQPNLIASSSSFTLDSGYHYLAIQPGGNTIKCLWDESEVISFTDNTPFRYGALAVDQRFAETHFDQVRAKNQGGPNPSGATPTATVSETPTPTATPANSTTPTPSPSPSVLIVVDSCLDGTILNACSTNKPNYCDGTGTLVLNCTSCGCGNGQTCNATSQNCYMPTPTPTSTQTPTPTPAGVYITNVRTYSVRDTSAYIHWDTNIDANGTVNASNYHFDILNSGPPIPSDAGFSNSQLRIFFSDSPKRYAKPETINFAGTDTPTPSPTPTPTPTPVPTIIITVNHTELISSHSLLLTGLTAGTTFYYQVYSCNNVNCNQTAENSFLTALCNDSDGGIFPNTTGNLLNNTGTFGDSCINSNTLRELYCSGSPTKYISSYQTVNCDTCSNGACGGVFCYNFGGGVQTQQATYTDGCYSNQVYTYSCDGAYMSVVITPNCGV